jgi:2-polyprenyl-3-methyl-5-hydroxy-6-metoxy-1,4-benzoquinol methylase
VQLNRKKGQENRYRRPVHSTLDFDKESDVAVIEQLVRVEYFAKEGFFKDKRVLDVGCGTGYTCQYLSRFGNPATVTGLEVDQNLVDNLRASNKDDRILFDFYEGKAFPYQKESFDVVTCYEVIEHITHSAQKNLLKEMSRVLTSKGVAILSTPNLPVYSPDGISLNPEHICEMDSGELDRLCGEYFFDVLFLGQCLANDHMLKRRQIRHRLSHLPLAGILKRIGLQNATRFLKRFRSQMKGMDYYSKKHSYRIGKFDSERALIQIAICSSPRYREK